MKHVRGIAAGIVLALVLVTPAVAAKGAKGSKGVEDLKFPPLPEFLIAKPEVVKLANGMTLYLVEDHELPLINVMTRVRAGSIYDPADKAGLSSIFGQVQREGGTTSMTGEEIDDFLEARAASVETSMSGDFGSASMDCLREDFDDVLAVFNDVLRNPVFDEEKIELAKVQTNTGIARRNDNVGGIVGREFQKLIYGADSPLTAQPEYATVAGITRDDLLALHRKYYAPNNIALGVVGDFDSAEMKKKLEQTFGSWEKGAEFKGDDIPYNEIVEPGVYYVEKDDVTQANIRLGHLGTTIHNPDYFALQVLNEVLGGGFSGRLMQKVRSDKGLAYSVFGGVGAGFTRPGVFQVGVSTKSETMAAAVDALYEEIRGIVANPPTQAEIDQAKETILNSFIFNYASMRQILGQQMTYAYYGLPANFLETYRTNIEKVTPQDTARVAKKYIKPDEMVLMVVGNSEDYDRPVASFGDAKAIDITIPDPPDISPEVVRSAGNLEAGAKLLSKASSKIAGGKDISGMRVKMTTTVSMQGNKMSLGQDVAMSLPDRIRQTMTTPMGEVAVVINGDKGVQMMGGNKQPLPAQDIEKSEKDMLRSLIVLLSRKGAEGVAAGSAEVGGKSCQIVAVTAGEAESRLCIDDQGLVLRQTYQGQHPMQGAPGMIEMIFSDYRPVDGRVYPYTQVMNFEGQEVASSVIESLEFNPILDDTMFEIPN